MKNLTDQTNQTQGEKQRPNQEPDYMARRNLSQLSSPKGDDGWENVYGQLNTVFSQFYEDIWVQMW